MHTATITQTGVPKKVVKAIAECGQKVFSSSCKVEVDEDNDIMVTSTSESDLIRAEWYLRGMISGFFTMKLLED